METVELAVSIASGAVGLVTGVVALALRSRHKALPPTRTSTTRLASYRDESALAKPRQPPRLRMIAFLGASAMLVPAPVLLWGGNLQGLYWLAGSAIYFLLAHTAGRDHSPTRKTATVVVESPREAVTHQCHEVLRGLGFGIIAFDLAEGVIKARHKASFFNPGAIMNVIVESDSESHTKVTVESDAVWTTVWLDLGANQRNVDRFMAGLLGH